MHPHDMIEPALAQVLPPRIAAAFAQKDWLKPNELCALLEVSRKQLYILMEAGRIPFHDLSAGEGKRRPVFSREDLESYWRASASSVREPPRRQARKRPSPPYRRDRSRTA